MCKARFPLDLATRPRPTLVITSESQTREQLQAWAAELWQALEQSV